MNHAVRAWSFLAILSLTLIVLGHAFGGREGLMIALILTMTMNSFVYFYEDRRVLGKFAGQELEGQDPYGLGDIVRRLSLKVRIPNPRLIMLESSAPQALVVGRGVTHGTLLVTEGLLKRLDRQEVEAVLAYQIASIKTVNTLAFAVGSFIATLALNVSGTLDGILRILIVEKKNPRYPVSQLFTRMAAPFIGTVLKLSIRPSLYHEADRMAAEITGNPKALANALWKLTAYSETHPLVAPTSIAHMFIVSPLTVYPWLKPFRAQPKIRERIQKLIGYYPV